MRLVLWVLFSLSLSSFAVSAKQNHSIEVSGAGSFNSVPDRFSFSLSIEQKGAQAAQLNSLIMDKTAKVIKTLTDIGVEKKAIQSLHVQFNPWIDYNGKTREQKGFILTRKVTVTLNDLGKYNKAIDSVLSLGINQIYGFKAYSSQSEQHYQTALERALLNAKKRATAMANIMNLKLGPVVSIFELSNSSAPPIIARSKQFSAAESYQPGELSTDAKVKVVFTLLGNP